MRKLIYLIIISLISATVFSEVTRKVTRYPDGKVKQIFFYSNGKEISRKNFDEQGKIQQINGNIPDGIVKEYYENGKLFAGWNYKENKLKGISKIYYPSSELMLQLEYGGKKLKVSDLTIPGTGIVSSKPDVFIKFFLISNPCSVVNEANFDINKKIDILAKDLNTKFSINIETMKTSYLTLDGKTVSILDTGVGMSHLGYSTQRVGNKIAIKKPFMIRGLIGKKEEEISRIIKVLADFGAVDVKEFQPTFIGVNAFLGHTEKALPTLDETPKLESPINFKNLSDQITKSSVYQMINIKFKEDDLRKMIEDARVIALKDIKNKIEDFNKAKKMIGLKKYESDFKIQENIVALITEKGELVAKSVISISKTQTPPSKK